MSDVKTTCEKLLEGVPDDAMILVHKVDVIRLTTSPVSEANGFDIRRAAMARMRLDLAAWIARRWQTTGGVVLLGAITGAMVAGVAIAVHWSVR